ncbi:MAG: capsule biosynthesis protein [Rubellimicrobium sp.]|nr:capsule biosynthesis protein [Rubellimicrobium sp.]
MARRVAQKHAIAVTSDFDAVRQLRLRGIDPFQRSHILDLVRPSGATGPASGDDTTGPAGAGQAGSTQAVSVQAGEGQVGRIQLPQTRPEPSTLPSTERVRATGSHVSEVMAIQRDILNRRRRKVAMLFARLAVFVLLPTFIAGWYFFVIATPMYATKSEFVIQQAESAAGAGLGGLFQGTSMATQQDSITVQSYLSSRAAFRRLDESHGFKAHFSDDAIDPIQRLPADATNEAAFRMYQNRVRLSYDPTEGIIRMEVVAADPEISQQFSEALIAYAEEQVDQLTQRLREDQMSGARASYEAAERRRAEALSELLRIQSEVQQIDPIGETAARTAQISALETSRQQLVLDLQQRLAVARPNEAQVASIRSQIENIEALIADMRAEMTQVTEQGASLAARNTELRLAEENYTFQTILVQQALQMMEAAQIEANRQVRFLSLGVEPVAPDEATYPRAFENTLLAFLIFAGIYLMVSLTVSILREQVTS